MYLSKLWLKEQFKNHLTNFIAQNKLLNYFKLFSESKSQTENLETI